MPAYRLRDVCTAADDALTISQPLGAVGRQCGIDIVVARQVIGQSPSIARRFGCAHADMRPRHEGRIADQRDAADYHRRGLQVDDRLQQRLAPPRCIAFGERSCQQASSSAQRFFILCGRFRFVGLG